MLDLQELQVLALAVVVVVPFLVEHLVVAMVLVV
jgi:hypothetical protein